MLLNTFNSIVLLPLWFITFLFPADDEGGRRFAAGFVSHQERRKVLLVFLLLLLDLLPQFGIFSRKARSRRTRIRLLLLLVVAVSGFARLVSPVWSRFGLDDGLQWDESACAGRRVPVEAQILRPVRATLPGMMLVVGPVSGIVLGSVELLLQLLVMLVELLVRRRRRVLVLHHLRNLRLVAGHGLVLVSGKGRWKPVLVGDQLIRLELSKWLRRYRHCWMILDGFRLWLLRGLLYDVLAGRRLVWRSPGGRRLWQVLWHGNVERRLGRRDSFLISANFEHFLQHVRGIADRGVVRDWRWLFGGGRRIRQET